MNIKKKDLTGTHSFDIAIAVATNERKAILLKNLKYWCDLNRKKNRKENFHNGRWWTYNTAKDYKKVFPYWNARSISRWLKECVNEGWLIEGNFTSNIWDQTKWHSVTEKYNECLLQALKEQTAEANEGQPEETPAEETKASCEALKEENDFKEFHEERKLESSFDVKEEILNQNILTDSPENRVKVWLIFQEWIKHESFLSLWGLYADRYPEVDPYELMKVWVQKADWFVVTNVKVNLLSGWIETANQKIQKLKSSTNGKSRNNKNLISTEDAKTVFADLVKNGI